MTQAKTTRLKQLLNGGQLSFLMEAHNGLSAKIAEEAGFPGLWGSGLSISASCGVRDNNELSWTQVLDIVEYITDATTIPLLLDGDTGYGNFNNMRRLVNKLEARGVAGVCIEDKLFPKTNSFIDGEAQPLADVDEFAGKIKAGKDAQHDPDFCVIARIESFIAGWGLDEALRRAEAYHAAGADGILIHSKLSTPSEVLAFKKAWGDRSPVVIVPTKYYSTPTEVFRNAGFNVAIWANHLVRSAIKAMQNTAALLMEQESLVNVEERVVTVAEVFRIQGDDELREAEKRYLPTRGAPTAALILAASQGRELGELTQDRPKTLVPIAGRPLLERMVDTFNSIGIKDISVVRGFKKEMINLPSIKPVDNDEFETTQEVYSLALGLSGLTGAVLISYGDVLFQKYIPMTILESKADICLAVDANWEQSQNKDRYADWVVCDRPYDRQDFDRPTKLLRMGAEMGGNGGGPVHGEWIGLMKLSPVGLAFLQEFLATLSHEPGFRKMRMKELLNRLLEAGQPIEVKYSRGHWLDIDELKDVVAAGIFGE